jgi:hypothetical protein
MGALGAVTARKHIPDKSIFVICKDNIQGNICEF